MEFFVRKTREGCLAICLRVYPLHGLLLMMFGRARTATVVRNTRSCLKLRYIYIYKKIHKKYFYVISFATVENRSVVYEPQNVMRVLCDTCVMKSGTDLSWSLLKNETKQKLCLSIQLLNDVTSRCFFNCVIDISMRKLFSQNKTPICTRS